MQVPVPVMSHRALALADFILHKSMYWSVSNYERRVDESVRQSFLQFVEQQHKESRDNKDLEGDCVLFDRDSSHVH